MQPPPNARELLRKSGLSAKKSWGQNFLCDAGVLSKIAEATDVAAGAAVVELGAGLGALTYHLLRRGAKVVAVERDRDLLPLLQEALGHDPRLEVRAGNAAEMDYAALAAELGGPVCVVGNLPYQISSRILVSVADAHQHVTRGVFLVQKEVGQRLGAAPGSRAYGLLSVLVQRHMRVEVLREVPPHVFFPPPKVTSVVVRLRPHGAGPTPQWDEALVATARAAFSARRKTLVNALAGATSLSKGRVASAVTAAGLTPTQRAETLGLSDFLRLAKCLWTSEAGD